MYKIKQKCVQVDANSKMVTLFQELGEGKIKESSVWGKFKYDIFGTL
jgi:hypothetical protein